MRMRRAPAAAMLVAFVLTACVQRSPSASDVGRDDAITVASFNFSESILLAEIYAQAMERSGLRVQREIALGTRELVMPALVSGLVEFVPEYSGSALQFLAGPEAASAERDVNHRALMDRLERFDVATLDRSPAQDQNGFAVTRATAARFGLRTLSDLASVSDHLVFGGPPECVTRPLCLPGLEMRYGIRFRDALTSLDAGGPRTVAALAEGDVDVALLFTSDGAIDLNDFVVLADDRGLQPAENITPLVRRDTLSRFGPSVSDIVDTVSARLTTAALRSMNAQVAHGDDPAQVATRWLDESGLGTRLG